MKRVIALVISVVVLCVFTACGIFGQANDVVPDTKPAEGTQPQNKQPLDTEGQSSDAGVLSDDIAAFSKLVESCVDVSNYDEPSSGNEDSEVYCEYSLKTDVRLNKKKFSPANNCITVDTNTKVTTGESKVSDLLLDGWKFNPTDIENAQLGVNRQISGPVLVRGGVEIRVGISNTTEEIIEYKDGTITYISLDQYDYNDREKYSDRLSTAVDFDIDGVVNQNSNLYDLVQTLGEPESLRYFSDDRRTYIDVQFGSMQFKLSADGNRILTYTWY